MWTLFYGRGNRGPSGSKASQWGRRRSRAGSRPANFRSWVPLGSFQGGAVFPHCDARAADLLCAKPLHGALMLPEALELSRGWAGFSGFDRVLSFEGARGKAEVTAGGGAQEWERAWQGPGRGRQCGHAEPQSEGGRASCRGCCRRPLRARADAGFCLRLHPDP